MSIRESFSDSIARAVMEKYDKEAVVQISTVFWPVYNVAFARDLSNWTF